MTPDNSALPRLQTIAKRLPIVFPEGVEHRNYVVREMAARTIFVMFYVGAIEGTGHWLRPAQVRMMTDAQAAKTSEKERLDWAQRSLQLGKLKKPAKTWYAADTREPIRDETLRFGLIPMGAVIERSGVATTSSLPRYALARDFAELFDVNLTGKELEVKVRKWQEVHLSVGALARVTLIKRGAVMRSDQVLIKFSNGETRLLSPGLSSIISKAVIEEFAPRYLYSPAVLWLSESGNKVISRDDELAKAIGFRIQADKNLPDIILVDTGSPELLVVFVEVVATAGPINQGRKGALLKLAVEAGFDTRQVAFLTAFIDRTEGGIYRKTISELAWGSFVWFASEPEHVVVLRDGQRAARKLVELL